MEKLDSTLKTDRRMVFIGDYIDRGPDSKGVVDYLLEFRNEHDCVFLRGNHEQMLLDAIDHDSYGHWMMNGGDTTLRSYDIKGRQAKFPEEHLTFYRETELYYDTEDYFFVHAGLSPAMTVAEALKAPDRERQFLWERSHLQAPETVWEKTVVFGHTPQQQPILRDRMIGIDTGCIYDSRGYGQLTAVLLPEVEFIQQQKLD